VIEDEGVRVPLGAFRRFFKQRRVLGDPIVAKKNGGTEALETLVREQGLLPGCATGVDYNLRGFARCIETISTAGAAPFDLNVTGPP